MKTSVKQLNLRRHLLGEERRVEELFVFVEDLFLSLDLYVLIVVAALRAPPICIIYMVR